ncbi:hypothetical protein NDA01_21760 [Trichocoleus desertorum AS-A10]|uniref:hypothetical protein n=1 Tax=Trichocoleus desertorum TaxID=1481672 RepID=UPI0032998CE4
MLVSDRSTFLQTLEETKLGHGIKLSRGYILKTHDGYTMRIVIPNTVMINRFWTRGEENQMAWFLENWEAGNAS